MRETFTHANSMAFVVACRPTQMWLCVSTGCWILCRPCVPHKSHMGFCGPQNSTTTVCKGIFFVSLNLAAYGSLHGLFCSLRMDYPLANSIHSWNTVGDVIYPHLHIVPRYFRRTLNFLCTRELCNSTNSIPIKLTSRVVKQYLFPLEPFFFYAFSFFFLLALGFF